ncbi:helix-turn-helix domain-containing protein [Bacillus sp. ISL-40]|uniref:hypothetical protein n=1 Tax=unclassified Bacillus (in: firmicutes) TaxID=185979 RepID=UPI001BE94D67|nr:MULTISPECIES: hypothetical protein [unclassified Bacillus (in: firmicutes)]MBT2695850.1 helix-turn-helix domain-containing protein [Bacillus sp. ISL-40]MBT2724457.1 helix-turn-helix domain-containing protein [Bacillus sp. ISL-46]MBT2743670.1 helix-turn-helix domain-containing protein [Bacillus sp. ISL-77]
MRKVVFLLAVKGLKTADFRFKREDVLDDFEENNIVIQLKNRSITLRDMEATCFREYYAETMYSESDFVFNTTPHGEHSGGPIQVMSILNHLRAISSDYLGENDPALTLISIRRAMALNLYIKKRSIQDIAKELGIEENSASNYLKYILLGNITPKS